MGRVLREDLVLSPRYLEILATLIAYVDVEPRVAQVSATGDTFLTQQRRTNSLCPMWHAWAFALRREHYQERRPIIDEYLRARKSTENKGQSVRTDRPRSCRNDLSGRPGL
jgi:hypothetical protein